MIEIRKATEQDTRQLEELFLITRRQTFKWENPEKFKLEDYAKWTEGEVVFVAENEDEQILGFISVWVEESPPFIHNLYILPEHQRKGVGELLIRSLFSWLPPPYRLKCEAKNWKALSFYLKNKWYAVERGINEGREYFLLEFNGD